MQAQEVSSSVITAKNICKVYTYYKKETGLKGSIKNLFYREKLFKKAVNNLSFEISKGEITGLIGLNGAGKTTTLKMLSGLIMPTRGEIKVLGYSPFDKKKEYLCKISMVMGNKSQLWWDLPAADSFELNKTIYGLDDIEYKERLNLMTEMLDVKNQINVQVRRLSLGERMKMELIASLIHKPEVVFLDEPTIGLDVITQYKIREFLKEYCLKYKAAIVLTSHNFNDIISLCNSLILINNGEKIYSDSFENFKKEFLMQKYFILKLKNPNAEELIKRFKLKEAFNAEFVKNDSIKISVSGDKGVNILKNITLNFIDELNDVSIESVSMDEIIRKIYQEGSF
ncbi:ABC transporter ATP-binding protein [Treponema pedis]|uniref:ABC transporter ATP-binding protein n=1 Tax=Treponema pedis str. T A4 TaxID=1291379 RepID=S6A842_9SPIR|nr:ATP-binding cassette domain-containing protein [Treponema pedis]AGT43174.1 ABC transporter ATP-binding protein [Treponema pedis str. T A4]